MKKRIPKPACPKCRSKKTWKFGWVVTDSGRHQRYQCKACGFRFRKK